MKIEVEKLFPKIPNYSHNLIAKIVAGRSIEDFRLMGSTEDCRGRHQRLADGAFPQKIKYLMGMA